MNRIEFSKTLKVFAVSLLCALPFVIILDILISAYVSVFVLTVIDVICFVVIAFLGFLINEKRQKYIEKKRNEIKANKAKSQNLGEK